MTTLVGIVGKQTVQRISIRFPKREGQSRISNLSDFGHGAWLWFGCKRDLPPPSLVHGHAGGGRQMTAGISEQIHPLLILARPLVQLCEQASGCRAQVFHAFSSPAVSHARNLAWRRKREVQNFSASGAQSNE